MTSTATGATAGTTGATAPRLGSTVPSAPPDSTTASGTRDATPSASAAACVQHVVGDHQPAADHEDSREYDEFVGALHPHPADHGGHRREHLQPVRGRRVPQARHRPAVGRDERNRLLRWPGIGSRRLDLRHHRSLDKGMLAGAHLAIGHRLGRLRARSA